jgi:hypothetical protein
VYAVSAVTLTYEDGTIRVDGPAELVRTLPGVERDERSKSGRAPAYTYAFLRATLDDRDVSVDDRVLDAPALDVSSAYELRDYQQEALETWLVAGERGVL